MNYRISESGTNRQTTNNNHYFSQLLLLTKVAPNSHQSRTKFAPNSRIRELRANLDRIWSKVGAKLMRTWY